MDLQPLIKSAQKNPLTAALIVNKHGIVEFINDVYLFFLNLKRDEVIGRYIGEITPDSRTLKVIESGKEIMYYDWIVNGRHGIACSVPLYENGEILGAFAYSIFLDLGCTRDRDEFVQNLIMNSEKDKDFNTPRYGFDDIIGEDQYFVAAKALARQVALHDGTTVMITGETGTGKELFAQAIHNHSFRMKANFVRVNCAGIPDNLLESELFGYDEGAFTGAKKKGKAGKLELAHRGTIFLDEIGEMPLGMQSKLLVFLEEREVERLGGNHPIKVDARIIAATNRDLEAMVEEGRFRSDLYYRLNVLRLEVPPLRNRRSDVVLLVQHFLKNLRRRLVTRVEGIDQGAVDALTSYSWPGNVRELQNVLERAVILADLDDSRVIHRNYIALSPRRNSNMAGYRAGSLKDQLNDYEKSLIRWILEETGHDKAKAARYLSINLSSLYRKVKRYGLE